MGISLAASCSTTFGSRAPSSKTVEVFDATDVDEVCAPDHPLGNRPLNAGDLAAARVGEHDPASRHDVRSEQHDVPQHVVVLVTTIHPQERDQPVPLTAQVGGKRPEYFQAPSLKVELFDDLLKRFPRLPLVRVDADHDRLVRPQLSSLHEPGGGAPLVGAYLQQTAPGGRLGCEGSEQVQFPFRGKPPDPPPPRPPFLAHKAPPPPAPLPPP